MDKVDPLLICSVVVALPTRIQQVPVELGCFGDDLLPSQHLLSREMVDSLDSKMRSRVYVVFEREARECFSLISFQ